MNQNTVEVEVRQVYGNRTIYPVNETAQIFATLTGKKTFSNQDIALIRDLGFFVTQVQTDVV